MLELIKLSWSQFSCISCPQTEPTSSTTQVTTDTGSTSFSILIPAITLTTISDQKAFSTEAIVTQHTGLGSGTGVHETYQFVAMSGDASFAMSLLESVIGTPRKAGKA